MILRLPLVVRIHNIDFKCLLQLAIFYLSFLYLLHFRWKNVNCCDFMLELVYILRFGHMELSVIVECIRLRSSLLMVLDVLVPLMTSLFLVELVDMEAVTLQLIADSSWKLTTSHAFVVIVLIFIVLVQFIQCLLVFLSHFYESVDVV
jgi:hypothetical protein